MSESLRICELRMTEDPSSVLLQRGGWGEHSSVLLNDLSAYDEVEFPAVTPVRHIRNSIVTICGWFDCKLHASYDEERPGCRCD